MFVEDFEYDGKLLSGIGYIICSFNDNSERTVPDATDLSLNTVSFSNGMRNKLVSATYDDKLTATFQICKNPCLYDDMTITLDETRILTRWLCRKNFHKFCLMDDGFQDVEWMATFTNISRIYNGKDIIGLELTIETDKPFAYSHPIIKTYKDIVHNWTFSIGCESDEENNLYPEMKIKVKEAGTLKITNDFDGKTMVIKNCQLDEVISVNHPMIEAYFENNHDGTITTTPTHTKIQNDFNWVWFRIGHKYESSINNVTVSLPCEITITYQPIVKLGLM